MTRGYYHFIEVYFLFVLFSLQLTFSPVFYFGKKRITFRSWAWSWWVTINFVEQFCASIHETLGTGSGVYFLHAKRLASPEFHFKDNLPIRSSCNGPKSQITHSESDIGQQQPTMIAIIKRPCRFIFNYYFGPQFGDLSWHLTQFHTPYPTDENTRTLAFSVGKLLLAAASRQFKAYAGSSHRFWREKIIETIPFPMQRQE